MNDPDSVAAQRHRNFGAEMASTHFKRFPSARFEGKDVLDLMNGAMGETAADHGIGSRALEPYARAASAAFLRTWRALQRGKAPPDDGWRDWPATE